MTVPSQPPFKPGEPSGATPTVDPIACALEAICRRVLKRAEVDMRRSFFELGGNSFLFIHYVAAIEKEFGVGLSAEAILRCRSIRDARALIEQHLASAAPPGSGSTSTSDCAPAVAVKLAELDRMARPRQGIVSGPVAINANRHSIFFRRRRELEYWNVKAAFELSEPVHHGALRQAVRHLIEYHDGLRLRGQHRENGWTEFIVEPDACSPLVELTYEAASAAEPWQGFVERNMAEVCQSFRFPGDLFKVLCLEQPLTGESVLYVAMHHLLVDGYSASLVRHDLLSLYDLYRRCERPTLPAKTTSLIDYAAATRAYWLMHTERELAYWRSLPWHALQPLPMDNGPLDQHNQEKFTRVVVRTMPAPDADDYVIRFSRNGAYSFVDVVLAAIARAYTRWSGHDVLHLAAAFHCRAPVLPSMDLTRTAGYLTQLVPLLLPGHLDSEPLLREVHHQVDRANLCGQSYGVLKYFATDEATRAEFDAHPQAALSINIVLPQSTGPLDPRIGRRSARFKSPKATQDETQRVYPISGGVYFAGDELHVSWDFSTELFAPERIEAFADLCVQRLAELAASVLAP